jgi:hypothetical protein
MGSTEIARSQCFLDFMQLTFRRATCRLIVLFGVLAAFARQALANICPPSAIVEGPVAITGPVTAILRQHGMGLGPSACATAVVHAFISDGADSRVHILRIQDRFGRSTEREFSSAETAASLIESWVFEEDADLIAPRPDLALPETALQTPVVPPPPSRGGPLLITSAEISRASDDSTWYGASIAGCLTVRVVCVGARGRFGRSTGVADSIVQGDLTRTGLGAMGLVTFALRHGRVFFSPTLGIGAEWVHTVVTFAPVTISSDDIVLRGEGGAIVGLSIVGGWSLLAELGATWGPRLSTADRQGASVLLPLPPGGAFRAGVGIGFSR